KIGTIVNEDVLVFEEKDETFSTFIYRSKSRKYLIIGSESTLTSEYRILEADSPDREFRVFSPREQGLEYSISHYQNQFYILTNKDEAENFKLMVTPENQTSSTYWKDLIPHRRDTLLEGIDIFKDYLVLSERANRLHESWIKAWNEEGYYLPFDNETYTGFTTTTIGCDTESLRYADQSLATAASGIDFNMRALEKEVEKEQVVLGEFNQEDY